MTTRYLLVEVEVAGPHSIPHVADWGAYRRFRDGLQHLAKVKPGDITVTKVTELTPDRSVEHRYGDGSE